jgi:hypothetical protein
MSGVAIDHAPIARRTPTRASKNTAMPVRRPPWPAPVASGGDSLAGSSRPGSSSGEGAKEMGPTPSRRMDGQASSTRRLTKGLDSGRQC